MFKVLVTALSLTGAATANAQEHFVALAFSSRQVYIVSNGGTQQQCEKFIRARKDKAKYACVRYQELKSKIRNIFGDEAANSL